MKFLKSYKFKIPIKHAEQNPRQNFNAQALFKFRYVKLCGEILDKFHLRFIENSRACLNLGGLDEAFIKHELA